MPVVLVPVVPAEPYVVGDVDLGEEAADVAPLGSADERARAAVVPVELDEPAVETVDAVPEPEVPVFATSRSLWAEELVP